MLARGTGFNELSNIHGVSGCVSLRHLAMTRIDDMGDADGTAVTLDVRRLETAEI